MFQGCLDVSRSCLLLGPCCLRPGGGRQGLRGLAPCSTSDRRTAGGASVPWSWCSTWEEIESLAALATGHGKVGPFTAKKKRQGALFGCCLATREEEVKKSPEFFFLVHAVPHRKTRAPLGTSVLGILEVKSQDMLLRALTRKRPPRQ